MPDLPTWEDVGASLTQQFPDVNPSELRQRFEQRRSLRLVQQASGPIDLPTWEQAGPQLSQQFPDMNPAELQNQFENRRLQVHAERQAASGDEDWWTYIRRRMLPGASTFYNFVLNKLEGEARDRIRRGVPSADVRESSPWLTSFWTGIDLPKMTDYQLVAAQDRLKQIEQERSTPEQVVSGLAHIPAIMGEALAGGAVLRGVGAAVPRLGFLAGGAAPAVATEAPPLLSSAGLRAFGSEIASNAWRGLTSPAAWGRTAAQTALTPSMYLPEAARRAAERPEASQWYEIRNLGPAYTLGFAQTAILGSLGGVANNIPGTQLADYLRRGSLRMGTGMAEQQIIDVLAGATGLQSGYGVMGDVMQGRWGEALQHATVQAATFAVFAGIHEVQHGAPKSGAEMRAAGAVEQIGGFDNTRAEAVLDRYRETLQTMRKSGLSHEAAGNQLNNVFDAFINELKLNPYMNRGDARELAAKVKGSEAIKEFAKYLGETFPERAPQQLPAQGPEPGVETQQPPEQIPAQGPSPGLEGPQPPAIPPNRMEGPFAAPGAREAISPTQMPPPEMVNLRQPQIRQPFAIFADAEVRGIAKEEGVSTKGTRQEIIERMRAKLGDHKLAQLEEQHMPGKLASMSAEELNQAKTRGLWYGAPQVFGTPKQPIAPHERPGMAAGPVFGAPGITRRPPEPPPGAVPAKPTTPPKPVPTAPEQPRRSMKDLKELFQGGAPAEEVMSDAGMTSRERFVVGRLLRGATLEEIAAEPKMATKQGTKLSRERVRQIAAEGLDKINASSETVKQVIGEEKAAVVEAGAAAKKAVEEGKAGAMGLAAHEEGGKAVLEAPITGYGKKGKKSPAAKLQAEIDQLVEDWAKAKQAAGGKLDPKREKMFTDEITRLNDLNALYRSQGGATAEDLMSQGGAKEGGPGQFEMIARQNKIFGGNPEYIEKNLRGNVPARAQALMHEGAIITQKMAAGDPVINLEENFHIWSVKEGFEANPQALPRDVAEGLRQFYQDFAKTPQPLDPRTMIEGVAHWFLRRSLGQLENLTPQQEAAAKYAENFIKEKGFTAQADQIQEMYGQFREKSRLAQVAGPGGLITASTKPIAQENRTFWQQISDKFQDTVVDNMNVLKRAGMERAYLVYRRLMHADHQTAQRWGEEGVGTIQNGHYTIIGPSKEKMMETLTPADRAEVGGESLKWFEKGVTKAEAFATIRHVLNERARGEANIAQAEAAAKEKILFDAAGLTKAERAAISRNAEIPAGMEEVTRQLEQSAQAKLRDVQNVRDLTPAEKAAIREEHAREIVTPEQYKYYEALMKDFQADPEFVKRASVFADRLTQGYNATLQALSSPDIHRIPQRKVDLMIADKPDYISTARVKEREGPRMGFMKGRTGSGEQIISPLLSYERRLQAASAEFNEQVRRNAAADYFLNNPDMAQWGLAYQAKLTKEGEARFADLASKHNIPEADVAEFMAQLGPHAGAYYDVQPWSHDATKNNWYWHNKDGELISFRIKDKAMYEVLSGIQGDSNAVAQWFRWMGKAGFDTPFGRIEPMRAISSGVRTGAATLSLAFNVKNALWPFRDPLTYVSNTINKASVAELPKMLKDVYAAEIARIRGELPDDALLKFYFRERGREQHMFSAESNLPEFLTSKADTVVKILNALGAGELAPRILEVKNRLEQQGWTMERLSAETKKAEAAAKEGKPYVDPVPWDVVQDVMNAGNEVTTPFDKQGYVVREISKIMPFFGPAVAGSAKWISNWKTNPTGAAVGLGVYLTFRLIHWSMFHNEDWYQQLSPYDRFRNFIVPIPGLGLRRLPGPLGAEVAPGAVLTTVLDAAARNNPDFGGALEQTLSATLPPGVERVAGSALQGDVVGVGANAFGSMLGPAGQTAADLARNRNFMGTPIVPKREEHLPASQQLLQYQLPYVAQQALGGRFPSTADQEGIVRALGVQPFLEVTNLRRSVNDVFERLHTLEGQRTVARRAGTRFDAEREYQVLSQAATQLRQISQRIQGITPSGRQGEKPSDEEVRRLREQQTRIARTALERVR